MTSQLKAAIDRMYAKAPYNFHFKKVAMFLDCAGNDVVFEAPLAFYKIMTGRMNWKDEGVIAIPFTGARTVSENLDALKSYTNLAEI
ncbi:hypothetical protein P261_02505 [Lachnospiraceae bacterium TWA4]|nr:hypothetical protein P261_02505 [Lachnospiraceae bacterium TWA4]